ncbi:MAG: double-strand break repair helicase AddA [Rhodobacteraceae bacterium]|nr:double-strand break repair helicase AddA [Paracoccaceae bacterium]
MAYDQASLSQNRASEPLASTWLSANAGSGKTKVLTDRVARLLLSGVSPQNILCLTYTKAAASEMQNRLFKLLGSWAMKDDAELRKELEGLGESPDRDLHAARRLFARAIETPGGLKIQTIHSFCSALLRRFPLEARVSPQFSEMDERAELILREEVVEAIAMGNSTTLANLAAFYSGQDFGALTKNICSKRHHFAKKASRDEIWQWHGLRPDCDEASIAKTALLPRDTELCHALVPILQESTAKTELTLGKTLGDLTPGLPGSDKLEILISAFLTASGTIRKHMPTKKTRLGPAEHLIADFDGLLGRVEQAREQQKCLYSARKTLAMHRFARPFLKAYEERKLQRGWVDFDDLIDKAGALLSDPSLASWVLYRLDGGIDHILVDEAQDTSPAQWKVIRLLAQEFTSGEGARNVERTIFVVGDPKQSIYSFQGAEPAAFSDMKDHFSSRLSEAGRRLENLRLEHSFRSAPAILQLADHALVDQSGLGDGFRHIAFFNKKPGRVDLWPVIEKVEYKEERHWSDASDLEMPQTHMIQLGRTVAAEVRRLISEEQIQDKGGVFQPVRPKDILILVRKRTGELFNEIIRACKELDVPIAGADRMRIGGELAVKDLTALLRFLATPEDDLSLAAVLRSPIFGLSEGELYGLAQPRPENSYLWKALRRQSSEHPTCIEALSQLRNEADFLRPYELLERILTRFHGRTNLLARLGNEAEDGIDALLSQALTYENTQTPSLTGFLDWLDVTDVTIKRQMDSAGDQIRVMTVHGAKGLEAPIVILPDTGKTKPRSAPDLLELESGELFWKPRSEDMPIVLNEATGTIRTAEEQESSRLLYVAATRAENWLIVAAAGDVGKGSESWYNILAGGMESLGSVSFPSPLGRGWRFESGKWLAPQERPAKPKKTAKPLLPQWALSPVTTPNAKTAPLSPSDLGGEKVIGAVAGGLDAEAAKKRGRQLHLLLEVLPKFPAHNWQDLCKGLLAQGEDSADAQEIHSICNEVTSLLTNPRLAHLFTPDTLAEVDISAHLPALGGQPVQGIIDRLIISADKVLVVDFKSNAVVPVRASDIPDGILRQMGAYIQALGLIYPDSQIECSVLWTANANLMPIPTDLALAALAAS